MPILWRLSKISLGFIALIMLAFLLFLAYMSFNDYKPQSRESVENIGHNSELGIEDSLLTFLTWNIGYGGLGKESDFFFDGGKGVRQSPEITEKNEKGIYHFLKANDSIDFILLQEVDLESKRSYYNNQVSAIGALFPQKQSLFAKNYDCSFVPQPIENPYGKCLAGIQTLTKFSNTNNSRIALSPDAAWPMGLFMLDRCLLESRFPLPNGKELYVYNMHLSAYDDGTVKQEQMSKLKELVLEAYHKGNYVVVGGDWNQYPPEYLPPSMKQKNAIAQINVEKHFPEKGWNWGVDIQTPTNRKLESPFSESETDQIVIDFFLTSPNLHIEWVKGIDMQFEYSDHQPVLMQVKIAN